MTRFERKEWKASPRAQFRVFETNFGRVAITIRYDVEFPEITRAASGKRRISSRPQLHRRSPRISSSALLRADRGVENQMRVAQSSTLGSLPMVPVVSLNHGQSLILTPSDFAFSRDSILAERIPNQASTVIVDLNLTIILQSLTRYRPTVVRQPANRGDRLAD